MKKEEIMQHLLSTVPNVPISEKDNEVLEALKSMEQLDRINTLCDIMDDTRIDLETDIMEKGIMPNYRHELMALRKANEGGKTEGLDVSAEATSQRAFDILNK